MWKPNAQTSAGKTGKRDFFLLDLTVLRVNEPLIYLVMGIYDNELRGSTVKDPWLKQ